MASDAKALPPGLDRLPSGRVRARYRCDGCARHGSPNFHSKSFTGQRDAERWLREQRTTVDKGQHVDPQAGKLTFQAYAEQWLADRTFDTSTREAVELRLRIHAYPVLGKRRLPDIKPTTVQAWLKGLAALAPAYRRVIFVNVSSVLASAVADELLAKNPCDSRSVTRPKVTARQVVPWTASQVLAVREALPEQWRVVVTLAAGLGLRQGEVFGLSPDDVDFLRGRVEVRRQVKVFADGSMVLALPKGGKTRTVPLPDSVRDALAAHLAQWPAREVELPWGEVDGKPVRVPLVLVNREGNPLNRNYFNTKVWKAALRAAGATTTRDDGMHALRHFYASALLDGGESIKAVSSYLGHADAGFTLRTYTHLMPTSDLRTRSAVDAALAQPARSVSPGIAAVSP